MPNVITPNSQSMPQPDQAAMMGGGGQPGPNGKIPIPPGKPGGDIMISQAEAVALTALETDDPKVAHKRARAESGMSHNQIKKLEARAKRARAAGFTLKGGNLTLRPTNHATDTPLGHGLATDRQDGVDDEDESPEGFTADKPAKKAAAKKTKENDLLEGAYFHLVNEVDRSIEDELKAMWKETRAREVNNCHGPGPGHPCAGGGKGGMKGGYKEPGSGGSHMGPGTSGGKFTKGGPANNQRTGGAATAANTAGVKRQNLTSRADAKTRSTYRAAGNQDRRVSGHDGERMVPYKRPAGKSYSDDPIGTTYLSDGTEWTPKKSPSPAQDRSRLAAKVRSGRAAARAGGTGARAGKSSGVSSPLTRQAQATKLKAKKFGSRLSGSKYRLAHPK